MHNPFPGRKEKPKRGMLYDEESESGILYHLQSSLSNISIDPDLLKMIGTGIVGIAVVVLGIAGIVAIVNHFNEQKSWAGTISELHYSRSRYVEQYTANDHETWWNTIPTLGYNSSYIGERVRGSHIEYYWSTCMKTNTTYDSKGRSHTTTSWEPCRKSKSVDDYDRWFRYKSNEWTLARTVVSEERQNKDEHKLVAVWPEIGPLTREFGTKACGVDIASGTVDGQASDPLLGCQRVAGYTNEGYWITYHYSIDGKPFSYECAIDQTTWASLRVGEQTWGKYFVHNEGFDCKDGHIGVEPTATPPAK